MNRNFGCLEPDNRIAYADDFAEVDGVIYTTPTAEHYARMMPPRLPIVSEPPERLGVTFAPTEYGDVVDGVIRRRYSEHPIPAPVPVYSVEEVIYSLITRGKLQPVKAVLGDFYDLITMRETVSADNEILVAEFPRIKAALVAEGILTEDEIDAVLKEAEVTE